MAHSLWTLLVTLTAFRSTAAKVKNEEAQAVSFIPADAQKTKMYADFLIPKTEYRASYLIQNVLLRLRTVKNDALVFYSHDTKRNFVQLELRGGLFHFKYNQGDIVFDVRTEPYVSDGKWHSFHIGNSVVTVDKTYSLNVTSRNKFPLSTFSRTTALRKNENIRQIPKIVYSSKDTKMKSISVFVGAVAPAMGDVSPFIGCLRDLQIGEFRPNLKEAVATNPKRVVSGCKSGCARSSCQNGGSCLERWNGQHRCNCWNNAFVGPLCNQTSSNSLSGFGSIVLQFPMARSVPVIGGKFGFMTPPSPGQLILHIDGTKIDVGVTSGGAEEIYLIVRTRTRPIKEYRISGSLSELQSPFLVRFWLLSVPGRFQLQLNDQQPVQGNLDFSPIRAEAVIIGEPTTFNQRRNAGANVYNPFKGCLYNFQLFLKGSDFPIEQSDRIPKTGGQCPPFVTTTDMNNTARIADVKNYSESTKWMWYRVVLGILGAMIFCLFIVGFVFMYHSCLRRSRRRQNHQKGTYSELARTAQSSTIETPNGMKKTAHSIETSPQHSVASTHLTATPYKIPFRPPYVATSLIIRDGKHMAHIDSDVDLVDSDTELP